jgi:hypothetical protein
MDDNDRCFHRSLSLRYLISHESITADSGRWLFERIAGTSKLDVIGELIQERKVVSQAKGERRNEERETVQMPTLPQGHD